MMTLAPSLWRTCRVLANRTRLDLLSHVLRNPWSTVSTVAAAMRLPECVASSYLRALNARGLLRVARRGRFVRYKAAADPLIPEAAGLLKALAVTLQRKRGGEVARGWLTGFTHPRRIELLKAIASGASDFPALQRRTRFSMPALSRHLRKLRLRGYVTALRGRYRCACPRDPLAETLVDLALR